MRVLGSTALVFLLTLQAISTPPQELDLHGEWRITGPWASDGIAEMRITYIHDEMNPICLRRYGAAPYLFYMPEDSLPGMLHYHFQVSGSPIPYPVEWKDLSERIFWHVDAVRTNQSFYSPIQSRNNNEYINPNLFELIVPSESIPIPRDGTAYNLSIAIFSEADTTGEMIYRSNPYCVLIKTPDDYLDSLLWICSTPHADRTLEMWDFMCDELGGIRLVQLSALSYYMNAGEWQHAQDTVSRLLWMYENNVDSAPQSFFTRRRTYSRHISVERSSREYIQLREVVLPRIDRNLREQR